MINVKIDSARHVLILTADNEGRAALKDAYGRGGYYNAEGEVAEALHEAYEFVRPENVPGALTDAPILVDCDFLEHPDNGDLIIRDGAAIYWFPDYMVTDPFDQLKNTGRVEFVEGRPFADTITPPPPLKPEFIRSHFPGGDRQGCVIWIGDWSFPKSLPYLDVTSEYPELARSAEYEPDSWDTGAYFWDHKGRRHGPFNGGCDGYYKAEKAGGKFCEPEPDVDPRQLALAI